MATNDAIWNKDGTPKPEAVQAQRLELRGILRDWYAWEQEQIDKIIPENLPKEESVMETEKEREAAVDAALEAWKDDMRKSGWTEEKIEEFLLTH